MNVELLNAIENADGSNAKVKLLKAADGATRVWLRYAFDPFITFGVTAGHRSGQDDELDSADVALFGGRAKTARTSYRCTEEAWTTSGFDLLKNLASRAWTGGVAQTSVKTWLDSAPSPDHAKWGARVLNKDLRIGIGDTLVLKAIPGLFEPFSVQLAHPMTDKHLAKLSPGYKEPKLDGLRMLVVNGKAWTRNGHLMQNVDHIIAQLRRVIPSLEDWVIDGETIDPAAGFQKTISKARGKAEASGLTFAAFDVIDRESWRSKDTPDLDQRKSDLRGFANHAKGLTPDVRWIKGIRMESPTYADLIEYRDEMLAAGYEGAMFKAADRGYEFKRSDAVLKVKKFETLDCTVIGMEEGEGKHAGRLGAFIVQAPDGATFNVGTGYSDVQRRDYFGDHMLGAVVEIRYQNRTEANKARFPSFVRERPDKR